MPDWIVASVLAVIAAIATRFLQTQYHGWGDDFAQYILQGKAFDDWTLGLEVMRNSRMLALSDVTVGPPAVPWGYPATLWLASHLVGWEINDLKVVGVLVNALLAGSVYMLARNYLSRWGAAAVAALIALQPVVLLSGDGLGSDILGLASCAIALGVAERLARPVPARPRVRGVLLAGAALLAVVAFSIRSNGAFVAVAMFVMLGSVAVTASPQERHIRYIEMLMLTLLTSVILALYIVVLPDGELAPVRSLTAPPEGLRTKLLAIIANGAAFVPFPAYRRVPLLEPLMAWSTVAVVLTMFVVGAWQHRTHSAGLVSFALLNYVLLLVFPGDGGARYFLPILLPVAILAAAGMAVTAESLIASRQESRLQAFTRAAMRMSLCGLIVGMCAIAGVTLRRTPEPVESGPLTAVAESLFVFVRGNTLADDRISFFKPRALRLFTDRLGIVITRAENLDRADVVIFNKRTEDAKWQVYWQVDRGELEAFGSGRFHPIYESGQFVVYRAECSQSQLNLPTACP